jgi:FtsH-binding integral membrane protein
MSYALDYPVVAQASESARAGFIRRTYAHLAGAILAFAGVEALLLSLPQAEMIARSMMNMWFGVLLLMMGAGWVASYWARSETSIGMQYMGLGLYVVAEAFLFLPLLYVVTVKMHDPAIIPTAGIYTLAIVAGLTVTCFVTRSDFSHLYPILCCAGFLALGLIAATMFFGVSLGTWFSFFMIALACGYILYTTSNIIHHYRTDQHVAAALELFAAVALLFWYIIQIVARARND